MKTQLDTQELLKIASKLVQKIGDALLTHRISFMSKNYNRDIKSEADIYSESFLIEELQKQTGLPILSEEAGIAQEPQKGEMCWIIDPLDGTMNFTRSFPLACVSVALWQDDNPILGVIYDFNHQKIYTGIVGHSAECNGNTIQVSDIADASQAILATGFPVGRSYDSPALIQFVQQVKQFKKIRMIGSAAMSLAYVASGVFDVYHEEDIMIWDVAAGLAIVKASGGDIRIQPGSKLHSVNCVASNYKLIDGFESYKTTDLGIIIGKVL